MKPRTLALHRDDGVAWITLDRPAALNAFDRTMLDEIDSVLEALRDDDAVRVVVVTGRGRAFCAGADLGCVASEANDPDGSARPFLEVVQATFGRLREFPKPVIAALNGITMAGGLELALCCDILLAAEDAPIADAHSNVGVIPGAGGCSMLPRLVGPAYAKYLVFSGETVSAADLHRVGLIARLYPADALIEGAAALAARIARKSPLALRHAKRVIDEGLREPDPAAAMRLEIAANAAYAGSRDFREGVRAFAERRQPRFEGR